MNNCINLVNACLTINQTVASQRITRVKDQVYDGVIVTSGLDYPKPSLIV